MPLDKELAHFQTIKTDLLGKYEGKFALIKEENFLGAFDTAENAYNEGVKQFGAVAFLVRRITREPEVYVNHALYHGLMNARI